MLRLDATLNLWNPRASTPVQCGIHDSNASLLPYVLTQKPPFSVISTGTWVIAMSIGSKSAQLDPDLDTLINVTAMGHPAPSARFMGGREHDVATGGSCPDQTLHNLEHVLSNEILLMPALVSESGPIKGSQHSRQKFVKLNGLMIDDFCCTNPRNIVVSTLVLRN